MPSKIPTSREATLAAALIETLPTPTLIVDGAGVLIAGNRAAHAQVGTLRPGEALTLSLRAPEILDSVARVRASGAAETAIWRPRVPVERVFEASVAAIVAEGLENHVVVTLSDQTEAHRVERMRVDFVANVSHELRTPLASVLGFIETLQGPARDDANVRDRFLDIMRDQGRRMARLIDDLLSLSRIEQNEHLRPQADVDLVDVVRHVLDALKPMAESARSTYELDLPARLVIPGDRDELVRLAENLIENAIKYGERDCGGGLVTVSLSQGPTHAVLRVKDNGPGIAPEHLPRLTERFYRVDAGASRAKGGTGLGLALVKHIVARHRGRLSIESKPGDGATFQVVLPLTSPMGAV